MTAETKQTTITHEDRTPVEPDQPLIIHGTHYENTFPAILRDYARKNPYLNAASTYAIADVFGVSRQTIANWMKLHDAFREAVEDLRMRQTNSVESAMMKRILGCTVKETKTVKTDEGTTEQTVEKEIPPDPGLIRYYLARRCPQRWSDAADGTQNPGQQVRVVVENAPEEFA